jgi:1-deoxy-D-xylulose-5-phosphate reductoisomerase
MPPRSSDMARNLVILGSTGSIGRQTLDVVRASSDSVRVFGLAAGGNETLLADQSAEFGPAMVALANRTPAPARFPGVARLQGSDGMAEMVSHPEVDLVVVGSSGAAGLVPTLAALRAGKLVALANKETLIAAGPLIREQLRRGGKLVPIDSEHSAIWQCLQGEPYAAVERLTITASGGALRNLPVEALRDVTPEQALRHPTWSMGPKITVDSANLTNKGLEVLEARWIFDLPLDRIDVILHPQSIVHSLVTFTDSSVKAQLGLPDMRLPIQYALSHPERWPAALRRLDLASIGSLTFAAIDLGRYPMLALALEAGRQGGTYPAVLSAADEIAVAAFLERRIRFTDIPEVVQGVLDTHTCCEIKELDDILGADGWARMTAAGLIGSH